MKKLAYDGMKLDVLKIVEDSKHRLKVNAVITREGVYNYPDGRAFKSKRELLNATSSARSAKLTILDHPDSMVIMSQKQIYGIVEKPFFDRDKIRATLNFDKDVCPPQFLYDMRNGKLTDVSIGFYYQPDLTPGVWNGQQYDYVMRDIVIDHVAAGVLKGRCTYPQCGIGVDTMMRRIALDPFGEYEDFADCVAKNQDKDDPEAYCASVHKKITGKWPAEDEAGSLQVSNIGGRKVVTEETHEEEETEFQKCVRERVAEGMTQGEAEAHCKPATEPEDEPEPPPGIDQEEPVEKTPLERCVAGKIEEGMSEDEAKAWCEAELAGEHEKAADLVERSENLIQLTRKLEVERRKQRRRRRL